MQGIKLSENESKSIAAMYKDGMNAKDIADVLYISGCTVYNYLRKHGIVLRTVPNWSKYRATASQRNKLAAKVQQFALNID